MIENLVSKHLEVALEARARISALISGKVLEIVDRFDTNQADKLNTEEDES